MGHVMRKPVYAICEQQNADAQADLSLCWAHTRFVSFVMSRLKYESYHEKMCLWTCATR